MSAPTLDEAVEWRTPIWAPAVSSALDRASALLPHDARVLEIGYNTGLMSCYMAAHYGWHVVGYDISFSAQDKASRIAQEYGTEKKCKFRTCLPQETLSIRGAYDAVFIKSVLYHISDREVYGHWLDWLHGILKLGGLVLAIENGKGGLLDKFYRKRIKAARWAEFQLFDRSVEQEFRRRFRYVDIEYFGRLSQFFTPFPKVFKLIKAVEARLFPANSDHCFVASIVAQR